MRSRRKHFQSQDPKPPEFLVEYLKQIVLVGYENSLLEQDARNYEIKESELFYEKYLYFLDQELGSSNKVDVLPGVFDLLEDLIKRENSVLGLGTGNIEQGAWIKLDYAGLKKYFTFYI